MILVVGVGIGIGAYFYYQQQNNNNDSTDNTDSSNNPPDENTDSTPPPFIPAKKEIIDPEPNPSGLEIARHFFEDPTLYVNFAVSIAFDLIIKSIFIRGYFWEYIRWLKNCIKWIGELIINGTGFILRLMGAIVGKAKLALKGIFGGINVLIGESFGLANKGKTAITIARNLAELELASLSIKLTTNPLAAGTIETIESIKAAQAAAKAARAAEIAKAAQGTVNSAIAEASARVAAREAAQAAETARVAQAAVEAKRAADAAKLVSNIAPKIATRLGEAATVGSSTGPIAPFVDAALIIFTILTLVIDLCDPNGYEDYTTSYAYELTRKTMNNEIIDYFNSEQWKLPIIKGPLDKLKDNNNTFGNLFTDYMYQVLNYQDFNKNNQTANKYITLINNKINDAIKNGTLTFDNGTHKNIIPPYLLTLDQTDLYNFVMKSMCMAYNGKPFVHGEDLVECTYTDRTACDSSYVTSEDMFAKWNTDAYKDGTNISACILSSTFMKNLCANDNLPYNYDLDTCIITKEYCDGKGLEAQKTDKKCVNNCTYDCVLHPGQDFAEMIFGTTITRRIIQTFSPDQYNSCKEGETDVGYMCARPVTCDVGYELDKISDTISTSESGFANLIGSLVQETADGINSATSSISKAIFEKVFNKNIPSGVNYNPTADVGALVTQNLTTDSRCYKKCTDGLYGIGPTCYDACYGFELDAPYISKDLPGSCTRSLGHLGSITPYRPHQSNCSFDFGGLLGVGSTCPWVCNTGDLCNDPFNCNSNSWCLGYKCDDPKYPYQDGIYCYKKDKNDRNCPSGYIKDGTGLNCVRTKKASYDRSKDSKGNDDFKTVKRSTYFKKRKIPFSTASSNKVCPGLNK